MKKRKNILLRNHPRIEIFWKKTSATHKEFNENVE